jgi:hypothetical protein
MPAGSFLVRPEVSTERRSYIPMGFAAAGTMASNLVFVFPLASLYHFGILSSKIHNIWVRAVCGRLGNGYRYSKDIVYNNFPWPNPSKINSSVVEKAAKRVLAVRSEFSGQSLADLYDPLTMPKSLLKVHQELDQAAAKAYGFPDKELSEDDCVLLLFKIYQSLI